MARPAMGRVRHGARRPVGLLALLLPILLLVIPGVALAHAELIGIEPLDGERLAVPPEVVTLTFSEPVGLAPGGLRILDAGGAEVDDGPEQVDGPVVTQPLVSLAEGWYVATWGIVSEDGHIIRSAAAFAVGETAAETQPDRASAAGLSVASAAMRALTDLALLVASGAWAAWWLFGARIRSVRFLAGGTMVVALTASAAWSLIGWLDGGITWLESPAGIAAIARGAMLAVGLAAFRRAPPVAAAAAVGALLTLLGGGHAAVALLDMALQAAHLLAAAVWLGAAPSVLLVLRDRASSDETALHVARGFSRTAAAALAVVAAAGAILAWQLSDGFAAGLTDPWAVTLGAKVLVVAMAVGLGAWGRRHLAREPRREQLRRLFAVDATLLLVVATLSSMLTLDSPDPAAAGHLASGDRCATTIGDRAVSVILDPARAGEIDVRVDGLPSGIQAMSLDFRHQLTAGAALSIEAEASDDAWEATAVLPLEGPWEVTVIARVDAFTEERGACRVRLTG